MKITINKRIPLKDIPSASGISILHDSIYIVGDDSPYLFKLNAAFEITERIQVTNQETEKGRIPKPIKPDFEAIAEVNRGGKKELLVFGSGSKLKLRETLLRIELDEPDKRVSTHSLSALYAHLKATSGIADANFNIEGAAIGSRALYLFNRGNNQLFVIGLEAFLQYIENEKAHVPQVKTFRYYLPRLKGVMAGFSGACLLPDNQHILFTASLENTTDWYNDGEVLGSFIGLLPLEKLNQESPVCKKVVDEQGSDYLGKIESIAIKSHNPDGSYTVYAVTDSDGGVSELLEMSLVM